jgi:hypothetical protein
MRHTRRSVSIIKPILILGLSSGLLSGCLAVDSLLGGKQSTAPANTQVSAHYAPKQDVSQFGADSRKLKGTYAGIYQCGSITTQYVLHVTHTNGGALSGNVLRTNLQYDYRGRHQKSMTTDTAFTGSYDAQTALIQLRLKRMDTRNAYRHHQMTAWLYGVMLPDASGFVMFDRAPTSYQCSMWIARRGDHFPSEWEFLENEANPKRSNGFFTRRKISSELHADMRRKQCDPKLAGWLRNAGKVDMQRRVRHFHTIRMMYSDKYFVPYFGKPFHELDDEDRQILAIRLRGSCQRDRALMRLGAGTAQYMAQSFQKNSRVPDVDKGISNIGFNMLFAWLAQARQHFAYMAAHQGDPLVVKHMLSQAQNVLLLLFPVDRNAFTGYALAQVKQMILPRLHQELQVELAANPSTLPALDKLAGFEPRMLARYPDVPRDKLAPLRAQVQRKVNQNALAAGQAYAAQRQGIQGIAQLDGWQGSFKQVAALLDNNNKQQLAQVFQTRRLAIAQQLLQTETQRFQHQVVRLGATPAALKAGVAYEKAFARTYARVLNLPGYVAFRAQRQQARKQLLAGSVAAMSRLIKQREHERTLSALQAAYLLDSDRKLPAGRQIQAALAQRRSAVAPFQRGGHFRHYLNALYSRDTQTLQQLDRTSMKPIADSMRQLQKPMQAMGTILEAVSGGVIPGRKIYGTAFAGLEDASLITPIMAFYVLNYEKYNGACMDAKPHKRTVQYRWTETTTINGVSFVSDSGGYDTHYLVNDKFIDIFDVIYASDGNNGLAKFADRFFQGKGKIYRDELIQGTYDLMTKNCKSALIQRMEQNMIDYFNVARARLLKARRRAWQK